MERITRIGSEDPDEYIRKMSALFASAGAKAAFTIIIVAAAAVIIWLLLRNIRLWYWKSDKIIESIDKIGSRMDELENGIDNLKISAEKLSESNRQTNLALLALQDKSRQLLELQNEINTRASQLLLLQEAADEETASEDADAEASVQQADSSIGPQDIRSQVADMEQALNELKKQKELLEKEINARIRD